MPTHWAIDLGTSNTTVCEDRTGSPHIVHLPELARPEPLTQTPVIPSCVCVLDPQGQQVLIGEEALDYNWDGSASGFASGFKLYLGQESQRPLGRVEQATFTARDMAIFFLRELIRVLEKQFQEKITDLTIATPCGFFEAYRAELQNIVRCLKQPSWWQQLIGFLTGQPVALTFRTLDEPVAAALGYGVDLQREVLLVAFDFGAGSLEVAALRTQGGQTVETGRAQVLAKQSLRLGGDDVDRWILERFVPEHVRARSDFFYSLKWEAERLKLLASAGQEGSFTFRNQTYGSLNYHGLSELLAERGLYRKIQEVLQRLLEELRTGYALEVGQIDEVILEGGSTLLPEVRHLLGETFGREKVREWLPFESVARGACIFAGGAQVEDFIYHDYALRVLDEKTNTVEYELLIPRGTRYPTGDDFATRYYAPGFDGQSALNLFICEVGRVAGRPVEWKERPNGTRYFVPQSEGERAFCLCLNEGDEALPLSPPGRGTSPRLRVAYSVNADRWLCVTVHDLLRKADLKVQEPVVKLR